MNGREVVAAFDSRLAAELARSMLVSEGLDARLLVDDAGGMHPELPRVTGGVRLTVAAAEATLARELLAEDHSLSTAAVGAAQAERGPVTDDEPSGRGSDRRVAAVAIAVGVALLLVAVVLAVQQGGLLEL